MTSWEIGQRMAIPWSTVSGILRREGLGKLKLLEPKEAPRRYERSVAGELVHLDEYNVDIVAIDDGLITLGRSWGIGDLDVQQLIDSAEKINDLPFVLLRYVVEYKEIADRPKDRQHLAALRADQSSA